MMRALMAIGLACLLTAAGARAMAQDREEGSQDHGSHGEHRHGHGGDHDATMNHRFDDVERWVDLFDDPSRDEWQKPEEVVRFLQVPDGGVVADLGAGTGYFTMHLARAVGPDGLVFAVDIEPDLVEHIAERVGEAGLGNVRPVLAERDHPELAEWSTDLIFVCDTWHHIDDRVVYLGKLERILRKGGRVAVVDFREGDLPVGPPAGHKLSRDAVVAEFEKAGWSLADESDALPFQYLLVFRPPEP
jgi:ubiquinone/menaquinone biosynthesis C-methylase UbiE